jgi:Smg protein
MFDILQYLYDHYLVDDRYPNAETLARKLATAGFDQAEIEQALTWLDGLSELDPEAEAALSHSGMRLYNDQELMRLAPEGRGFLTYLEDAGLLSAYAREWVIERALALDERVVPAEKIKWIALLALWKLGGPLSALWLEDLVRKDDDDPVTLH